jgi:PAS domain S-box-containing protein
MPGPFSFLLLVAFRLPQRPRLARGPIDAVARDAPIDCVHLAARDPRSSIMLSTTFAAEDYRLLAEHSPLMLWRADTRARCTYLNSAWLRFTGRRLADEIGLGWATGLHPDDAARCLGAVELSYSRRVPFELAYRLRRHDGHYGRVLSRGAPAYDERGRFAGYVGGCVVLEAPPLEATAGTAGSGSPLSDVHLAYLGSLDRRVERGPSD